MTLNIDIQYNSIECHYAECRDYLNVMLSVILKNVIMLSVVSLNVVLLRVIAPKNICYCLRLITRFPSVSLFLEYLQELNKYQQKDKKVQSTSSMVQVFQPFLQMTGTIIGII
jgi:hypothetical protein